ncbi:phosphatidic acid phosphatase type 2/haloperoxidase [Pelagophyceae sp. CCMP2097]|nr:phosphatidic acid phosphatase type 2/haloperoxidase [Pelagophyceae sp. CCMP2097]
MRRCAACFAIAVLAVLGPGNAFAAPRRDAFAAQLASRRRPAARGGARMGAAHVAVDVPTAVDTVATGAEHAAGEAAAAGEPAAAAGLAAASEAALGARPAKGESLLGLAFPRGPAPGLASEGAVWLGCRPGGFRDQLATAEFGLLRRIQALRGLRVASMVVHYSLLPKVITPLLALVVWLASLPQGASLIVFVCAQDMINTAIKWAVQRPRPRWYSADAGLIDRVGAWEVDLSFPSAHTQFFAGLACCAGSGFAGAPLPYALIFGGLVGLTRNYLSVHWPTDTLAGLAVGCLLGVGWARHDPYRWVLEQRSPFVSLMAANALTALLVGLMVAVRKLVPPVDPTTCAAWYANALKSLSPEERAATHVDVGRMLQPRTLKSKVPMFVTVWCTVAVTALYPALLPGALAEPAPRSAARVAQAGVGVGGLVLVALLKTAVSGLFRKRPQELAGERRTDLAPTDKATAKALTAKAYLKALTYVGICAWTFLLSQLVSHRVINLLAL